MESKKELREKWEKCIKEYKESNMNISAWCKANNIKPTTFKNWLYKDRDKNKNKAKAEKAEWLPVEINNNDSLDNTEQTITINVGCASINVKEGFNKKLLQEIITVIKESC